MTTTRRALRLGGFWIAGALALAASSCAADPYNAHPEALKIERIVQGSAALELQTPRPLTQEYALYEGHSYPNGGMVYQPFSLGPIRITPEVGSAIISRKARFGQVFGLLARGAVGESLEGTLSPRVSIQELTEAEQAALEDENRDRETIIAAVVVGKVVPPYDEYAVRRVFAYARYQILPDGLWFERNPGKWIVKGGGAVLSRMMSRAPVAMETAGGVSRATRGSEPAEEPLLLESPAPRVRSTETSPASSSSSLDDLEPSIR